VPRPCSLCGVVRQRHTPSVATHAEFLKALLTEFPEIREDIELCDGLPYMEMRAFATFTQNAKGAASWDVYGRAVRLAAGSLRDADNELRNELHVSYLEHLDFEGPTGPEAWSLLPTELQRAWHDIISYNEQLLGRPWVKTKPELSA
jgi:hypothetical protein